MCLEGPQPGERLRSERIEYLLRTPVGVEAQVEAIEVVGHRVPLLIDPALIGPHRADLEVGVPVRIGGRILGHIGDGPAHGPDLEEVGLAPLNEAGQVARELRRDVVNRRRACDRFAHGPARSGIRVEERILVGGQDDLLAYERPECDKGLEHLEDLVGVIIGNDRANLGHHGLPAARPTHGQEGGQVPRRRLDERPVPDQELGQVIHLEGELGMANLAYLGGLELERRNDPKVGPGPTNPKEEFRVFGFARAHEGAVREYNLRGD